MQKRGLILAPAVDDSCLEGMGRVDLLRSRVEDGGGSALIAAAAAAGHVEKPRNVKGPEGEKVSRVEVAPTPCHFVVHWSREGGSRAGRARQCICTAVRRRCREEVLDRTVRSEVPVAGRGEECDEEDGAVDAVWVIP